MPRSLPRRVVYALLLALLWLGFVVEGSHALFASAATLGGSTITTGTTSLLISNSQNGTSTTFSDTRPGFSVSLAPGQHDDHYLILKNASSAAVDFDAAVMATVTAPGPGTLAGATTLQFTPVDSSGATTGAMVQSALDTLNGQTLQLGVTIPQGTTQRFLVRTVLDSSYADQGQSLTYDLRFSGTQHYVP